MKGPTTALLATMLTVSWSAQAADCDISFVKELAVEWHLKEVKHSNTRKKINICQFEDESECDNHDWTVDTAATIPIYGVPYEFEGDGTDSKTLCKEALSTYCRVDFKKASKQEFIQTAYNGVPSEVATRLIDRWFECQKLKFDSGPNAVAFHGVPREPGKFAFTIKRESIGEPPIFLDLSQSGSLLCDSDSVDRLRGQPMQSVQSFSCERTSYGPGHLILHSSWRDYVADAKSEDVPVKTPDDPTSSCPANSCITSNGLCGTVQLRVAALHNTGRSHVSTEEDAWAPDQWLRAGPTKSDHKRVRAKWICVAGDLKQNANGCSPSSCVGDDGRCGSVQLKAKMVNDNTNSTTHCCSTKGILNPGQPLDSSGFTASRNKFAIAKWSCKL